MIRPCSTQAAATGITGAALEAMQRRTSHALRVQLLMLVRELTIEADHIAAEETARLLRSAA